MKTKQITAKIKSFLDLLTESAFKKVSIIFKKKKKHGNRESSTMAVSSAAKKSFILRKFKIQTRLIVSFSLLLVVMLIVTGVFSYRSSTSTIDEKVKNYSLELMNQTSVVLNNQISQMEYYFTEVGLSGNIQDVLTTFDDNKEISKANANRTISEYLTSKFMMVDDILNCTLLYGKDFSSVTTYGTYMTAMKLNADEIVKTTTDRIAWVDYDTEINGEKSKYTVLKKNINSVSFGDNIAKMVIIPKPNFLVTSFKDMDIGKDTKNPKGFPIFVIDADGKIISSRSTEQYPLGT